LFGDASSTSALIAAAPTVLINAKHSRDFEQEADAFARQWLRDNGIPQHRFDDLLCRLQASGPEGAEMKYLSSHPPTAERANCTQPDKS
jgi:predicted Zn-dependent protease